MKICPKCKNEYRDGITYCADCDCELISVNEENSDKVKLIQAPYPVVKKVQDYLEYCKFTSVSTDEPDENGMVSLYCTEKEYKKAYQQMSVYLAEEQKKAQEAYLAGMTEEEKAAMEAEREEAVKQIPPSNIYQNYAAKAEDNKSSAISFWVIGTLGTVLVVLSWFEVLPFSIGGRGNWFSHGVMFIFFILFIFIGFVSFKNAGKYKELVNKEADSKSELETFLEEQFSPVLLSQIIAETEEEAYFRRMTYMRKKVVEAFPELANKGAFVESLLDKYYDEIFG